MSHANARLNIHGRRLLVDRVRSQGWAVAHAAKAMGISRQCAHRWVARFDADGDAGLVERSSRPRSSPRRTSPQVEAAIVAARAKHRRGQDWLGPEIGVPARTVARVLRRHDVPYLRACVLKAWLKRALPYNPISQYLQTFLIITVLRCKNSVVSTISFFKSVTYYHGACHRPHTAILNTSFVCATISSAIYTASGNIFDF